MSCHVYAARALAGSLIVLAAQAVAMPGESGLTFGEALARATSGNPQLAAQARSVSAADALREQAALRPVPTLDVALENFAGSGPFGGVDSIEATVQASQLIERGGKLASRVTLAGREHAAADASWQADVAEVRAAVAQAFVATLAARERLALARDEVHLAEQALAQSMARAQAGDGSLADTARAKVAVVLVRSMAVREEAALDNSLAVLAAHWGPGAGAVAEVAGRLSVPESLPELPALMAMVPNHPRLAVRRAEAEARRAGLRLEQSRSASDVTVSGGLRFFRDGRDTALVAGFSMPLPVRNLNSGNIRAARENLTGAERAVEGDEIALRAELGVAWRELQAARAAASALRREALPEAGRAHDLLRRARERGEATSLELLDARRMLADVRRELVAAEAACVSALVRVDALTDPTFPLTNQLLSVR